MKKFKSNNTANHISLLLALIYLLCAASYIFFMPGRAKGKYLVSAQSVFSVRRQNAINAHEAIDFIRVIDRSILDDDQQHAARALPVILLLVFGGLGLFKVKLRLPLPLLSIIYNRRYHYLSICTFRI